ncbi:MAG TPA: rhamnulokinase family protein [Sedimentisphaerales bacterium]|nr:rhamnulokinase family protein [Sedimentisphaerales bacterium]
MTERSQYIAVDLGAESGRVMLGTVADDKLSLEEIRRFANKPVEEDGSLRWNFEALLSEVKAGISKAVQAADGEVSGIGFDSWGVDFGLIDGDGELIENPYHYRDSRTNGVREKAFELMSKRAIYENTGLQFLPFNTVYQLLAMRLANSTALAKAKKLVFMADLFPYYLCGRLYGEYTLASTSQLMDMRSGRWSKEIFDGLSLPIGIMPDIVKAGTVVGRLKSEIAKELGCERIPVIAVASHDTGSAVAAVPADGRNWAYISSGTWSLIGVEVPQAIINDKSFEHSFTNEGGVENTIRLLKNIMGLWLVQECRRQWQREGHEFSYPELTEMAAKARPFAASIDPDCGEFLAPGDMPARINDYLAARGGDRIDDRGQMIRMILESLALKYRWALEKIEEITGRKIECLHIVGGGIQNELLCQFAANATGKRVVTGPVEATASGNILMQAKAVGQIESLAHARAIVRNSFELKEYQPRDIFLWDEKYKQIVWE